MTLGRPRAPRRRHPLDADHGLADEWGYPIVPYDLTRGRIKCGDAGADIYRALMTGLNGTPMPSFAEGLEEGEAWDLVHFIQSLSPG